MNLSENNLKFLIYDAKKTIEFRYKISNNLLNISQIMNLIDDDHISIYEEKCIKKNPRIGKEYQIFIPLHCHNPYIF